MHIELFIDLVRERPLIYDSQHPRYCDGKETRRMWREISITMGLTVDATKKKWKTLRDCYIKHLKCKYMPTEPLPSKYKYWHWAERMEFLKPHVKFTFSVAKLEQQLNNEVADLGAQSHSDLLDAAKSNRLELSQDVTSNLLEMSQGVKFNPLEISHEETSTRRRKTSKSKDNVPSKKSRYHRYNMATMNSYYHDATELVFLGYAKTIKSFSPKRRAEIKMKIGKLVMEEEIAHSEETSFQNTSIVYIKSESSSS